MTLSSPSASKKILVCDDHILFCNGLSQILLSAERNYSVHIVHDSESCKRYLEKTSVDVFICDLNIDHIDGFTLLKEIKATLKEAKVILLSAYYEDYLIQRAEKLKAHAFLRKETSVDELISVIERDNDLPFYSQKVKLSQTQEFQQKDEGFNNRIKLSKQEKNIIRQIVSGKSSKEIAQALFISDTTVATHRRNINQKLGTTNVGSLIQFAHENNLCD